MASPSQLPKDDLQADMPDEAGRDILRETKQRSVGRLIAYTIIGLIVILILLIGITVARLFVSPLSVSYFVDQIESVAVEALPEGQMLNLDDAQVGFLNNGRFALQLTNLQLRDKEKLLLSAPEVSLEVSFLSLLRKKLRPFEIFVPSMQAHVQREKNGRLLIAGQDPGALAETVGPPTRSQAIFYDPDEPEFVSLIYSLRRAIKPLADDDLSKRPPRILIKNTKVDFEDNLTGKKRSFNNVAFSYNPAGESDNLWRIDFAVDGEKGRIGFAMAEFPVNEKERGFDGRSIEFRFADVTLMDLSPRFGDENENFRFTSTFGGGARLDFDLKGVLVDLRLALDVGAGEMEFGDGDMGVLDKAAFRFDWNPNSRILSMERGSIYFGETGGEFKGLAAWPETREGNVRLAIEGRGITLAARDNPHPARNLRQFLLQMKIGRKSGIGTIEHIAMIADEGSVQGSGSMAMVDGELTAGMSFVISEMPYDLMLHMWPVNIANGARKWLMENLQGGRTTGAEFDIAVTESMLERNDEGRMILPDEAVTGTFGIEGAEFKGFGDLPGSEQVSGSGVVSGRKFSATITGGQFVTKSGRHFSLQSGRFEIPDHSQKPPTGVLILDGSGGANVLGEIVDSDPLNVLTKENQKSSDLNGSAEAKVRVIFPFVKELSKEDVQYSAHIALKDFSSKKTVRGRLVEKADLVINTDGKRVDIRGEGKIDGIDTSIDLMTSVDKTGETSSKFDLVLSAKDRENLGLDLGRWLRGPIAVSAEQASGEQGVTRFEVDLTNAELRLGEIGWSKKAKVRGTASFKLIEKAGRFHVEDIAIHGEGFDASGSALIDKDDGLVSLVIEKFLLSRGDRLSLTAKRNKSGSYRIDVSGEVLDLRGKLQNGFGVSDGKSGDVGGDFTLNFDLQKVVGLSQHFVSGLKGNTVFAKGNVTLLQAKGSLDDRTPLDISTKVAGVPTVHIATRDAGSFLRFLGATDRVVGGRLALSVALKKGWSDIAGTFFLKDFKVRGQVEKEQSRKRSTQEVNSSFDKFSVNYKGKNGIYQLMRGSLKGPVLGATVSGSIDMRTRNLALNGTYIPAYSLNNIFSRLPIIGRALGNRENEGLIGITYSIRGDMSNPKIIINPASLLAPGVFRKIFEFQ